MPFVLILRSLIFNAVFYLNLAMLMLAALPAFLLPRWAVIGLAKQWGRNSIWLLRVICGTRVEYRGVEKDSARSAAHRRQAPVDLGDLRTAASVQ